MKARMVYAIVFMAVMLTSAAAQQPASQGNLASSDTNSQATVYVYRYKQFVGKALSPSVYCDGNELARMENGRYFAVRLSAGRAHFPFQRQAGWNQPDC